MRLLSLNFSLLENYTAGNLPLSHKKEDYLNLLSDIIDILNQLDYLRPIQTGKR